MNGSLRHRRRASARHVVEYRPRSPDPVPVRWTSSGSSRRPRRAGRQQETATESPLRDASCATSLCAAETSLKPHVHMGPDGVPPGGARDQSTGIRRPGTVAAPDRLSNSLYQDASWADALTQIVRGLEPERAALDPLHHVVGHDLGPRSRRTNTQRPGGRCPAPATSSARSARATTTSRLGRSPGSPAPCNTRRESAPRMPRRWRPDSMSSARRPP